MGSGAACRRMDGRGAGASGAGHRADSRILAGAPDTRSGDEPPETVEEAFAQRCRDSGLAVIVVLRDPTPEEVAVAFRRGAIDVLIPPFDAATLLAAVARAGSFKDLYQENMDYRSQPERATGGSARASMY